MNSCGTLFDELFFEKSVYEDVSYLSDATLLTDDGRSFQVHRMCLVKDSSFFRSLIRNSKNESNLYRIPHVSGEILNLILVYIYTGNIEIQSENIADLIYAADYLRVDSLLVHITNSMSIEGNNFAIYMAFLKTSNEEIIRKSYRFIQTNFPILMEEQETIFKELSFESVKQLLSDILYVINEDRVWLWITEWVGANRNHRLCKVYDLLTCMKIPEIDDTLADKIIKSRIVKRNPLFENLKINEMINDHSSLEVLKYVFECSSLYLTTPAPDFYNSRSPRCLHIIAGISETMLDSGFRYWTHLYHTFDENFDVMCAINDYYCKSSFLLSHCGTIYMFDNYRHRCKSENLTTYELSDFDYPSNEFIIKCLGINENVIYCIGAVGYDQTELYLKFYRIESGKWFNGPTVKNVNYFSFYAVYYKSRFYTVEMKETNLSMITQIYCTESNSFSNFPSPSFYRKGFSFIEYHGKLFIIGGSDESSIISHKVEVFDCETNTWCFTSDLPVMYQLPNAVVFNNQLIVYEQEEIYSKRNLPVMWNEQEEKWKVLEKPFNVDYLSYVSLTIHDRATINAVLERNRIDCYRDNIFEKSPFTEKYFW